MIICLQSYEKSRAKQRNVFLFLPRRSNFAIFNGKDKQKFRFLQTTPYIINYSTQKNAKFSLSTFHFPLKSSTFAIGFEIITHLI